MSRNTAKIAPLHITLVENRPPPVAKSCIRPGSPPPIFATARVASGIVDISDSADAP